MTAKTKLTDQDRERIIDLKAAQPDISQTEIIEKLGLDVDRATVSRVLNKAAAATGDGADGLADIPIAKIHPSPLNPRKHFDKQTLEELAGSLAAEAKSAGGGSGILQNLVVRPHPKKPGAYEIIAGERRFRAASLNVKNKAFPTAVALPCRIKVKCTDAQLLEIALVENNDRDDPNEMEEAAAFAQLRDMRMAETKGLTERQFILDLCERLARSDNYVRMRIGFADKLSKAAQDALRKGVITQKAARVLVQVDGKLQDAIVNQVKKGYLGSLDSIKREAFGALKKVSWAAFDVTAYTGEIVTDPDNPETRYFKDTAQAINLQSAHIEALTKSYETSGKWAFVKIFNNRDHDYFQSWEWNNSKDPKKAGVIIEIDYSGQIKVHEGKVPGKEAKSGQKSGTPAAKQPAASKKHLAHAKRRKTEALQAAVAQNPRKALELTCLALMGLSGSVRIAVGQILTDDKALAPEVRTGLDAMKPKFNKLLETDRDPSDRFPMTFKAGNLGASYPSSAPGVEPYEALKALTDAELNNLFAHLVSRHVGTFNDYDPNYGDAPLPVTLAADLGIAGNEGKHGLMLTEDDIEGVNREGLEGICAELGIPMGKSLKATREAILTAAEGKHVIATLRFGKQDDIQKALTKPAVTKPVPDPDPGKGTKAADKADADNAAKTPPKTPDVISPPAPPKAKLTQVPEDVIEVLRNSKCDGDNLDLPGQLDRQLYAKCKKAIENLGGKWNRKAGTHVFPGGAAKAIESTLAQGVYVDRKKTLQEFQTPQALAEKMAALAGIQPGDKVFEPSAGKGRLVDAARKAQPECAVTAIDIDQTNVTHLIAGDPEGKITIKHADTISFAALHQGQFNVALMNPPFSGGQDIAHITAAWDALAPGGRLVAICSEGPFFREDKKAQEFRAFLERIGATTEKLPAETFKESGTGVATRIVTATKSAEAAAEAEAA